MYEATEFAEVTGFCVSAQVRDEKVEAVILLQGSRHDLVTRLKGVESFEQGSVARC